MKIGMVYPQIELNGDPGAVRALAIPPSTWVTTLLAYDHVVGAEHADSEPALWGPYTEKDPSHDPFVLFSYLAGRHEMFEFDTGVIILPQRQTVLFARQAADLDLATCQPFRRPDLCVVPQQRQMWLVEHPDRGLLVIVTEVFENVAIVSPLVVARTEGLLDSLEFIGLG